MRKVFPGESYEEAVLKPAYDNAKKYLLEPMIDINKAHLVMLVKQGIIDEGAGLKIAKAIENLDLEALASSKYDGKFEDLFFYVESKIIDQAGDLGGNLHIARSRNDMGVTMYRMALRPLLLDLYESMLMLKESLILMAEKHKNTLMLAYTHTQPAQPTTLGHYLLAFSYSLARDIDRIKTVYKNLNNSPMGAAAITTTGFDIDRFLVAKLLGFDDIIQNSYYAIGGGDYLSEAASCVILTCIHTGRFIRDLLEWATREFNVIKIDDPYVQISSIMPQKQNPVALEHSRALFSAASATAQVVLTMMHNTPFGDIVDTEDDMQPYLWGSIEKTTLVFKLLANVINTMKINKELIQKRAKESFASVTELADTITREEKIPFRKAHQIVSQSVIYLSKKGKSAKFLNKKILDQFAEKELGRRLSLKDELIEKSLDPQNFVDVRKIAGGPAKEPMDRMLSAKKDELKKDKNWLLVRREQLIKSKEKLNLSFDSLEN